MRKREVENKLITYVIYVRTPTIKEQFRAMNYFDTPEKLIRLCQMILRNTMMHYNAHLSTWIA
uniref:Uncharacterized protein n=1 Tax=Megaselia scalaris TaxID=36166 RepID=T1GPV1_MEGSC